MHPDDYADFIGDGYSNESQRCFAEARMMTTLHNERALAYSLARSGRFVVFNADEVCCKATDALVGVSEYVSSHHATLEEALEACGEESEHRHIITPKALQEMDERLDKCHGSEVRSQTENEEIPF